MYTFLRRLTIKSSDRSDKRKKHQELTDVNPTMPSDHLKIIPLPQMV